MSYIGYSNSMYMFTKLLVQEFQDEYEGVSYIEYYEVLKKYLEQSITHEEIIEFFDSNEFCIFELDCLCRDIDKIVKTNIEYKQILHSFIDENIESYENDSKEIVFRALSLLFDDFVETYNENIFDYENFYISIFGIFLNLSKEKFMEFISNLIKGNSLTIDDFYFLINFLNYLLDFEDLKEYLSQFIEYSKEYLDDVDFSLRLVISMFNTFSLMKVLKGVVKGRKFDYFKYEKNFILCLLKMFTIYCNQYNENFLENNTEQDEMFLLNRDITYVLLRSLSNFPINEDDSFIIVNAYSKLVYDYEDYRSVEKVTEVVKYLISPVFKYDKIEKFNLSTQKNEAISILTLCYLTGINYVVLFADRCSRYGFDSYICEYVLKLILSEKSSNKKDYFIYFIKRFDFNVIDNFNYGEESCYRSILWIVKDIIAEENDLLVFSTILEFLSKFEKIENVQMFEIVKEISNKINSPNDLCYFEGDSFYNFICNDFKGEFYTGSLEAEYFYARNFLIYKEYKVVNEKREFIKKLNTYFKEPSLANRIEYYDFIISSVYFEVYKFDVLKEINFSDIDYNVLKKECDFLIYDSPNEYTLKLGLILSLKLDENIYLEVCEKLVYKTSWGDIFQKISTKFETFDMEEVLSNHKSFIFIIKARSIGDKKIKSEILKVRNKTSLLRNYVFNILYDYKGNYDVYIMLYIIVFSNYQDTNDKYNSINMITIKLKTMIYLIQDDFTEEISKDVFLYDNLISCIEIYTQNFNSLTQFEVLDSVYKVIEKKFLNQEKTINHKDIETDEEENNGLKDRCFLNSYGEILKLINTSLKSEQADAYYESIFVSEDIGLLISILDNESNYYNDVMNMIGSYIDIPNVNDIEGIYKESIKKSFIARTFIKVLSNYQEVLMDTLNDKELFKFYCKIVESSI